MIEGHSPHQVSREAAEGIKILVSLSASIPPHCLLLVLPTGYIRSQTVESLVDAVHRLWPSRHREEEKSQKKTWAQRQPAECPLLQTLAAICQNVMRHILICDYHGESGPEVGPCDHQWSSYCHQIQSQVLPFPQTAHTLAPQTT